MRSAFAGRLVASRGSRLGWLVTAFVLCLILSAPARPAWAQVVDPGTGTPTTTTITSSAASVYGGEAVTLTVDVTGSGGTPTGNVTIFHSCSSTCGIGFQPIATVTLTSGQATFTTSQLTAYGGGQNAFVFKAIYLGDSTFAPSESAQASVSVQRAPTTTVVTSSQNPSVIGQSVTFTAKVTPVGGASTFTTNFSNDLVFYDGTTVIGLRNIDANGVATLTVSGLSAGTHDIKAVFAGAIEHQGSTSAVVSQVVGFGAGTVATTTTISTSANPVYGGQEVTLTVGVAGAGGTPTGNVTIYQSCSSTCGTGFQQIATVALVSGQATFQTSALTAYGGGQASYTFKAIYGGDTTYLASESATITQGVQRAPTTTVVTSSLNPSVIGQSVTFTAKVTPVGGASTFTTNFSNDLVFYDGTTVIGLRNIDPNGVATLTVSGLSTGTHDIKAVFAGAIEHQGSTSAVFTQPVTGTTATTTSLTVAPNPAALGASVTLTANVTSASGTPTGTVTFKDGATDIGTGTLSGGVATLSISSLAAGSHSITAFYNGNSTHAFSTSSAAPLTIDPPVITVTTTSLASGTQGVPYGPVTLAASGGTGPYTFAAAGLPATMTLDPKTGVISGTPTSSGTFAVSVSAKDNSPTESGGPFVSVPKALSLVIAPAQPSWTLAGKATPNSFSTAGTVIAYEYTLTNTGPVAIVGIGLFDDKTGLIACPSSSLDVGASMVCKGDRTTGAGDLGKDLVLSATASGKPVAGTLPSAKASITVTYAANPSWTLASVPSPAIFSSSGIDITYTHTVKNTGNVPISSITVSGAKVGSCTIGTLAAGATITCTSTYTTVTGDVGADIAFAATAKGTPAAGTLADATSSGTVTFQAQPGWILAGTASPTTFATAGTVIAYEYTLTNTGNVSISSIIVNDDKTGLIACPGTSLAPAASMVCKGNRTIAAGDLGADQTLSATATGTPAAGTLAAAKASVLVTFLAEPAMTLATVANPTSFTGAGQTITYTHTVKNTGNVAISSITVGGAKVGSCAIASLAAGATTTCTSTYATLAGDVGANIAFAATAKGTPAAGTLADAATKGSVTFTAQPSLSLAVVAAPETFGAPGQTITYTYTVTNTGNVPITGLSIADPRVAGAVCGASTLALGASTTCTGTLVTTAADLSARGITTTAAAKGTYASAPVASAGVTTIVGLDAAAIRQATVNLISRFQSRRNDLLLQNGPDSGRLIDRLKDFSGDGAGNGGGGAPALAPAAAALAPPSGLATFAPPGGMSGLGATSLKRQLGRSFDSEGADAELKGGLAPMGLMGSTETGTRIAFSMNLRDVSRFLAAEDDRKQQLALAGLEMGTGALAKRRTSPNPFDIWVEGQYTAFDEDRVHLGNQGHFGIFKVGTDVVLSPSLLVGVMAQWDTLSMRFTGPDALLSGSGWMVGPYTAVRLSENVFFLGRAAWGRSSNDISPFMTYVDSFSSTRWLASGTLKGDWKLGDTRFRPSIAVGYIEDRSDGYTDSLGIYIPSVTSSLGQVTFGPEIAHRIAFADGTAIEPRLAIQGIWNFAADLHGSSIVDAGAAGEGLRGRFEGGARLSTPSGIMLDLSASYDGIGASGYHATTGRAILRMPLN